MIDGRCGVTQAEEGLIHHGGGLLPGPSGSILPLLQPTRCSSSSLLHQQWKQSRACHRPPSSLPPFAVDSPAFFTPASTCLPPLAS